MVDLLRLIAAQTQSYTVTSSSINSTIQLAQPSPFVAPEWAIRVNGLWFASLIVSIATASISMLVKQWLREFLAIDWATPQQRLRAHQYRRPALDTWKVFEIAAVLPILLQISLGLFFIGLCFFTASVDSRMGRISLPLVSAWAFFLITTTLFPLCSSRCPYKLPILKPVMRLARTHLTSYVVRMFKRIASHAVASQPEPAASTEEKIDGAGEMLDGGDPIQAITATMVPPQYQEEDAFVEADSSDEAILVKTDSLMANGNILMMAWDIFKQSHHIVASAQAIDFILDLVANRVDAQQRALLKPRLRCIPDLSSLPRQTWDAIMLMLSEVIPHDGALEKGIEREEANATFMKAGGGPVGSLHLPDWIFTSAILLLSQSPYPLPTPTRISLRAILEFSVKFTTSSFATWTPLGRPDFVFHPIRNRILSIYYDGDLDKDLDYYRLRGIYAMYLLFLSSPIARDSYTGTSSAILVQSTIAADNNLPRAYVTSVLRDIFDFTCEVLGHPEGLVLNDLTEGLIVLLGLCERINGTTIASNLFGRLWGFADRHADFSSIVLGSGCAGLHQGYVLPEPLAQQIAMDAFRRGCAGERPFHVETLITRADAV